MSFYGQLRQLFHISEPILSKQFFLNLNFCFRFWVPWWLKTSVNCVTNWKMPKFYPNSLGHDKINLDILWSAYCEVYTVKCILCRAYFEVHTVKCILWGTYYKCILWSVYKKRILWIIFFSSFFWETLYLKFLQNMNIHHYGYCIVCKYRLAQSAYNIFLEWTNIIGCIGGKLTFLLFFFTLMPFFSHFERLISLRYTWFVLWFPLFSKLYSYSKNH